MAIVDDNGDFAELDQTDASGNFQSQAMDRVHDNDQTLHVPIFCVNRVKSIRSVGACFDP